jgi:Cu/Ag efflux pump CusA
MTSLAFGFGVLPLTLASGAGAGAQRAIGTAVLGGVVTSTFLVTLFAPLFFVIIERTFGKRHRAMTGLASGSDLGTLHSSDLH